MQRQVRAVPGDSRRCLRFRHDEFEAFFGRIWRHFYGYQGAARDPEQLALTDQLLDAALGELACVAREQPCLLVGDFNVEPTKIPCVAKGIMAGLWVDLEASWALASGRAPGVTCKQDFESSVGSRLDFMVGCPRVAAAVSGCGVLTDRWVVPHFAVRSSFNYSRWHTRVSLPVRRSPLWPASWLPVLDKSRGSKAAEVQSVWDKNDDRLQFMSRDDAFSLDDSLTREMFLRLGWFGLLLLKLPLLMLIVLRVVLSLIMALCWVEVFFGLSGEAWWA